jgi:uncharacterized protein YfaS (alpha-2-macroglobulin family)
MKNTLLLLIGFLFLLTAAASTLSEVDDLINKQQFQEASKKLAPLVEEARKNKNDPEYAKLLLKETLLKLGLHGYETAVAELRGREWPKDPQSYAMVSIVYARSLKLYHEAYSWEIRKREQITKKDTFDLKTMTSDEIFEEAYKAYDKAWVMREKLGKLPRDAMSDVIQPNTFPKEVRGSLRDTLTYLFVELLNDSSGWKPTESHDSYLLNLDSLINGKKKVSVTDVTAHPLEKISSVLTDLESWHAGRNEKNAALEARLEKYRVFSQHFSSEKGKKELIGMLTKDLDKYSVPWVSMGYALLADFWKTSTDADAKIKAHSFASKGNNLHSSSPGAARCRDIIREIEQPSLEIEGMNIDTNSKRSIGVNYKNLRKLYFRSVEVDFKEFIKSTKDYSLRPGYRELEKLLKAKPAHEWSVSLQETKDFGEHMAYVVPPKHKNGFYVIMSSNEESFQSGVVKGIQSFFSDYTFDVNREYDKEAFRIEVSKGANGEAVKGANVSMYVADYQKGHTLKSDEKTDEKGIATFNMRSYLKENNSNYFFIVEKDGNIIGSRNPTYMYSYGKSNNEARDAFIYTDRSIYRPDQKILWKIVAYTGDGEKNYKIDHAKDVEVVLQDANGEKVQTVKVRTNSFGSASGEFTVPKGRLLGNWFINSDHGGNAYVKIEEYKRPTFLVEMSDKGAEFRLNRDAVLKGNGKYYFGMPLSTGTAKWTIQRNIMLPWWCFWGGMNWGRSQGGTQVASGISKLAANGDFEIKFKPTADEKFADDVEGVKYTYLVNVDVTDEGGETQSTSYTTTIGYTAVNGSIIVDQEFYLTNAKPVASFLRTDLNGGKLAGKAKWKLVKLKEPKETLAPSELPLPKELKKLSSKDFKHPDDLKLKRWNVNYQPEFYLRDWEEGEGIKGGELTHDASGKAQVTLPDLKDGVYRLIYETADSFGAKFDTQKEFMVVGQKSNFKLPGYFAIQNSSVEVGEKIRLLVMSGFPGQRIILETFKKGKMFKRHEIISGKDNSLIEIPVKEEDRGGMGFSVRMITDYQSLKFNKMVMVPWTNKEVEVAFSTMRDKLRPGSKETWAVTIKGKNGRKIEADSFELLAYMYDKSLDAFTAHSTPSPIGIYPTNTGVNFPESELGAAILVYTNRSYFPYSNEFSGFQNDSMKFYPNYGIGGPGRRNRGGMMMAKGMAMNEGVSFESSADMAMPAAAGAPQEKAKESSLGSAVSAEPPKPVEMRTNFSENGFWKPHLVPGKDGSVKFEFTVPDSVTSWQVWAHAISKDLQTGKVNKETRTIKELMVRPYLPRFFREGDEAEIKVVLNNSSDKDMNGEVEFDIMDEEGKKSIAKEFSLDKSKANFSAKASGSTNVTFKLKAPVGARAISVKVIAKSGNVSDGEIRPLPVLPGRVHLAESKFVTLKNTDKKEMTFPGLAKITDPTLVNDLFVVTLDAQLFYSVLSSVPYLVNYPYQCTEQMMNSFVATGILSSVFKEFPEVGKMATQMSSRKTQYEKWSEPDPNRKLALEEAPWLAVARGGEDDDLISVLHPDIARNTRNKNLRMLQESQTAIGGFPWFSGGPPSPYQTLYLLYGFSKAIEFKVDVPKPMIAKAWGYLHQHYITEVVQDLMRHDVGWEFVTFLNYVLSNYPDTSWSGDVFTAQERKVMLDFSFRHWKDHSPYLKSYLAMTLKRDKREEDAKLVWASVMDSAKTSDEEGTHWAQEDRSWLWYNDTIETHAMALRTGSELGTKRDSLDGMVHWLFLNKKLNHWKSTRGTAEVLYSLTHHLKKTKQLGVKEKINVKMAGETYKFDFNPDKYTGKKNQIVFPLDKVKSELLPVTVEKSTPGLAFASATWHYSTEKLPKTAVGDFFKVTRKFYKRVESKLTPVSDNDVIQIGDEVEVHLSLTSKHPAEYVHLRDPRAAGFEPIDGTSKHKWDLGIYWYEEIRDSGTNFFFERLPQGQYTFKYRIRASTAGKFRAGPAVIQPLYAPEFVGFSEGHELLIK